MLWLFSSLSFCGPGVTEQAECVPGPAWGCCAWLRSRSHLEQLRHCLGAHHLALLNLLFSSTCSCVVLACKITVVSLFSIASGGALLLPSRCHVYRYWNKRQEENQRLHFSVLGITALCHPVEWNVPGEGKKRKKKQCFDFHVLLWTTTERASQHLLAIFNLTSESVSLGTIKWVLFILETS